MKTKNRISQQDEEAIIMATLNGDLNAFNQLVIVYQDMVYNHVYFLLGEPESAEDVTQDSFIKAFQKLNGFRGGSFRGWLMKIATNSAYDVLRSCRRNRTQPLFPENEDEEDSESAPWLADQSTSVEDAFEQTALSKTIFSLLEELPDVYRIVLSLIDLNDFNYAEAAEALNIPLGTVKSRLARARYKMSEKILFANKDDYRFTPQHKNFGKKNSLKNRVFKNA